MTDDALYQAMVARDPRFDGVFFVAVRTTGIYCRPICPARTPARSRVAFYSTAAEAEHAGFRACFRCRPEVAPGHAPVDAVDTLVAAATARIAEGALNDHSLDELAAELKVSARHLRRALEARLGVSPVELAQSRRLALAKQLLQDTALPLTDIAFAAGFQSVRRFNAVFAERMGRSPSELRPRARDRARAKHAPPQPEGIPEGRRAHGGGGQGVTLRLDVRAPYDWDRMLGFLRERAIPGVETVGDGRYARVVHLNGKTGTIEVRFAGRLALTVSPELMPVLMPLVARVRRMFDLDARPDQIAAALGRDKLLAPMVKRRPGLRVPGAIDPFEAAVRALLGQQVSVAAATTLAGRFAAQLGTPFDASSMFGAPHDQAARTPTFRFPTPREVVAAGPERIGKLGLPRTRATAIHTLAGAIASGDVVLDGSRELEAFVGELVELPGIGPWTAHYLAMRALHVPDAFPAADLGVQKVLGMRGAKAAEARAEAWRPYRAYAVLHLWSHLSEAA